MKKLQDIQDEAWLAKVKQEYKNMSPKQRLELLFKNNNEIFIGLKNVQDKGNKLWGTDCG